MNTEEISALLDQLQQMRDQGREDEAKKLLSERMRDLPEELQERIMFDTFVDGIAEQAEAEIVKRDIQARGLAAAVAILEEAEKESDSSK